MAVKDCFAVTLRDRWIAFSYAGLQHQRAGTAAFPSICVADGYFAKMVEEQRQHAHRQGKDGAHEGGL